MELLKLSKFKLQLQALIADVHELKERERLSNEQLNLQLQKQKQSEEEYTKRIQLLEAEICALVETRQKLERKVDYLQNDNALLERKEKEMKEAIHNLLRSRESFVNAYEESTSEMKRSIEARDRKIVMLSEKLHTHLVLFDSIEKEALRVKEVVDKVQQTVAEKENIVAELKRKMEKVASFEELFEEKISQLESKSRDHWEDLQAKNKIITELEAQLEVEKTRKNCNSEIEELQSAVSAKDIVIEHLRHEKKALQLEVGTLGSMLMKIQDTFKIMHDQDRMIFDSQFENQEGCATSIISDDNSTENSAQRKRKNSHISSVKEEHDSVSILPKKNKSLSSCVSESTCSVSQAPVEAPCTTHDRGKILAEPRVVVMDSECSTTQAETSENSGRNMSLLELRKRIKPLAKSNWDAAWIRSLG